MTIFHDHKLEIPSGAVDSTNTIYFLTGTPDSTAHVKVYINGLQQFVDLDFEVKQIGGQWAIELFEAILDTGGKVDDIKVEYTEELIV